MIELRNLTKTYEGGLTALEDLNLQIGDGELVFIVGQSGAGKSSLTRLLIRDEAPTSGSLLVDGTDIGKLKRSKIPYYRRRLGIIFQDFRLFPDKTVYENVAFALRVIGEHSAGIRMKVNAALKMVELSEKAKAYPGQLSGGEQQRVALARALAGGPSILIADEPTGNIDPIQSAEFMELLCRIHNRYQKTVVVLTHEQDLARQYAERTVTISRGRIVEDTGAYRPAPVEEQEEIFEAASHEDEALPEQSADEVVSEDIVEEEIPLESVDEAVEETAPEETVEEAVPEDIPAAEVTEAITEEAVEEISEEAAEAFAEGIEDAPTEETAEEAVDEIVEETAEEAPAAEASAAVLADTIPEEEMTAEEAPHTEESSAESAAEVNEEALDAAFAAAAEADHNAPAVPAISTDALEEALADLFADIPADEAEEAPAEVPAEEIEAFVEADDLKEPLTEESAVMAEEVEV